MSPPAIGGAGGAASPPAPPWTVREIPYHCHQNKQTEPMKGSFYLLGFLVILWQDLATAQKAEASWHHGILLLEKRTRKRSLFYQRERRHGRGSKRRTATASASGRADSGFGRPCFLMFSLTGHNRRPLRFFGIEQVYKTKDKLPLVFSLNN